MKTLILDDTPHEWFSWTEDAQGILKQAIPIVAQKLMNDVGIKISHDSKETYYRGDEDNHYQCQLEIRTLNSTTASTVLNDPTVNQYDLYLIDCSIDGNDRTEGGVDFAALLSSKYGLRNDQICIVTNKDKVGNINDGTITLFRGQFEAILKDAHQRIADAITYRLCAPSRKTIALTEACNRAIHDHATGRPIFNFSHQHRTRKVAVIGACDDLIAETPGLPEPQILKTAIEDWCNDNGYKDDDKVESSLADHIPKLSNSTKNLHVLHEAIAIAISSADSDLRKEKERRKAAGESDLKLPKLKDWLFPRIWNGENEPFRKLAEKLCNTHLALAWNAQLPAGLVTGALPATAKVESSVPVSWFKVFGREWMDGLADATVTSLNVAFVDTAGPYHRCVLFWNDGNGYPNIGTLRRNAPSAFCSAAQFSHVFVASKLPDGTVALVEVLPDAKVTRQIPSLRVCIGATTFDFSKWDTGSVYLFMVPGLY